MKVRIGSEDSAIERDVAIPAQATSVRTFVAKAPLAVRRQRVRELVALNRRRRFRLIAGGMPNSHSEPLIIRDTPEGRALVDAIIAMCGENDARRAREGELPHHGSTNTAEDHGAHRG